MKKYFVALIGILIAASSPAATDNAAARPDKGVIADGWPTSPLEEPLHLRKTGPALPTPLYRLSHYIICDIDTPAADGVCGRVQVFLRDTTRGRRIYMYGERYIRHFKRHMRLKFNLYDYGYSNATDFGKIVGTRVTVYVDYFPLESNKTVASYKVKYYSPLRKARQRAWSREEASAAADKLRHRMAVYNYEHCPKDDPRRPKAERMRRDFWKRVSESKAQVEAEGRTAWEEWQNSNRGKQ